MQSRHADRGQAAVFLLLAVAALSVVFLHALATYGGLLIARTRFQGVADAVALASLPDDRGAAAALAARHGAALVSWRLGPGDHEVTVVVEVDGVRATARASDAP